MNTFNYKIKDTCAWEDTIHPIQNYESVASEQSKQDKWDNQIFFWTDGFYYDQSDVW